jgi:hypothetical protein
MEQKDAIKIFEDKKVRALWDEEEEKWYISVIDVIAVLTDSPNPQVYWRVMKKRLKDEANETVTNCTGLKMQAPDGKMRMTDVADTEAKKTFETKRYYLTAPCLSIINCITISSSTPASCAASVISSRFTLAAKPFSLKRFFMPFSSMPSYPSGRIRL